MTTTVALCTRHTGDFVPACTTEPERWTTATPDAEAKALCRACPLRWRCAREAWETTGAQGLWAGIVIPEGGRPRQFALRQLRSLAEFGGYPVRPGRRARRKFIEGG